MREQATPADPAPAATEGTGGSRSEAPVSGGAEGAGSAAPDRGAVVLETEVSKRLSLAEYRWSPELSCDNERNATDHGVALGSSRDRRGRSAPATWPGPKPEGVRRVCVGVAAARGSCCHASAAGATIGHNLHGARLCNIPCAVSDEGQTEAPSAGRFVECASETALVTIPGDPTYPCAARPDAMRFRSCKEVRPGQKQPRRPMYGQPLLLMSALGKTWLLGAPFAASARSWHRLKRRRRELWWRITQMSSRHG